MSGSKTLVSKKSLGRVVAVGGEALGKRIKPMGQLYDHGAKGDGPVPSEQASAAELAALYRSSG